jgi:hypothetical protein
MPEASLSKRIVGQVLGPTRLRRLRRAGWIVSAGRNGQTILFDPKTIRKALTRLERERVPADRLEIQRVRDSERRHGRSYVPHPRTPKPGIDEIELDFSAVSL